MNKILLSLVAVVLFTIAGLGWLASQTVQMFESQDIAYQDLAAPYVLEAKQLSRTLDELAQPEEFIQHWPSNESVDASLLDPSDLPLPAPLQSQLEQGLPVLLESENHLSIYLRLPHHQHILQIRVDLNLLQTPSNGIGFWLTLSFYFGVVLMLTLWLSPLLRRLFLLEKAANAIGAGQLQTRVSESRWSYIANIDHAFNRMASMVETLIADNRLLGRAVSHDLKTPLARLRFGFEMLEEADTAELRQRYHQRIQRDLIEMEALINRLLEFARLEEASIKTEWSNVNFNSLLRQCAELTEDPSKTLKLNLPEVPLYMQGDIRYLRMLVNNLLGNALSHAHTQVRVSLRLQGDRLLLKVEDDGKGIEESEREQVLKPFIRGRGSEQQGHGLGLAIVDRIAAWHGGKVFIDRSETLGGASILVELSAG